ncbi:BTB/POZ domain-containing protein 17 isoform X2 [Silurus meridionalis]|uniref:BTB/POZ domain-containing protein 17 isoform X2 n=1 Tax=Silurus meridionalis TaxID=175797 RepID=UPI001EEC111C|nr:BTB/POZ domain-containing protein 17 isoform X2 [Silurus meridionalis]
MCVLGPGCCSHAYLLFLLISIWHHISPLCVGLLMLHEDVDNSVSMISHSLHLKAQLEALLQHGNNSDVSLRVETTDGDEVKVIQAHTLVLSLQSQTFQKLLEERNGSVLVLRESPECIDVFEKFIRYLYCGELQLRLDETTALHELATKYSVSVLQRGLTEYMIKNLASASLSGHVVRWYEYATAEGVASLRASCLQFLLQNVTSVLRSPQWPSVSSELLMTLLQRSDLVLHSELELFKALETWLMHNEPDNLTVENVLRAVRYPMIPPRELFRLQRESKVILRYYESVRDLLYMAYQFHAASPPQLAKFFYVNCSLFIPRNYLAAMWGGAWLINSPARDDRTATFHTQLGPSAHDSSKRVIWNAIFTRSSRSDGKPRIVITPASSSPDFAGVIFQKTVIVCARQQGLLMVRRMYNFHQSTEENGDFLTDSDLHESTSEYLVAGWLHLHVIIKPIYQTLISTKK